LSIRSPDGRFNQTELGDFLSRTVIEEVKRVPGVGRVQVFGSPAAMRVWIDPAMLTAYDLSVDEIANAIRAQNTVVSPGRIGAPPTVPGQRVTAPLFVQGQLESPEEFADITLRANPDGSRVRLGDVARIEVGAQNYISAMRVNGAEGAACG